MAKFCFKIFTLLNFYAYPNYQRFLIEKKRDFIYSFFSIYLLDFSLFQMDDPLFVLFFQKYCYHRIQFNRNFNFWNYWFFRIHFIDQRFQHLYLINFQFNFLIIQINLIHFKLDLYLLYIHLQFLFGQFYHASPLINFHLLRYHLFSPW